MIKDNDNTFRILICTDNESIIQNLNQKIAGFLKVIPFELKIVKDGVRAINEMGKNFCQLFITDSKPVGIDIHYLLNYYQEESGGGSTIVISNNNLEETRFENCEVINWPISAWNEFEEYLKNSIPEELKIKYGLLKIIPKKFEALNLYIQKYKSTSQEVNLEEALIIMPKTFFDFKNAIGGESLEEKTSKISEKIVLVGENKMSLSFLFESLFLIILLGFTIYSFLNPEYESDSFFSIRVLFFSLSFLSFFVIVSNWTLRRYILRVGH